MGCDEKRGMSEPVGYAWKFTRKPVSEFVQQMVAAVNRDNERQARWLLTEAMMMGTLYWLDEISHKRKHTHKSGAPCAVE